MMVPRPGVMPSTLSLATASATSASTASATGAPGMRIAVISLLVLEMPFAGEDQREAVLVGGGDHLVVAHGAAGFDHRGDAGGRARVEAVAEREERVAGSGAA